jgi:hypothetical protein
MDENPVPPWGEESYNSNYNLTVNGRLHIGSEFSTVHSYISSGSNQHGKTICNRGKP